MAPDVGEPRDQRGAIERLELVELRAVDHPPDHFVHVVGRPHVGGDHAIELLRIQQGRAGVGHHQRIGLAGVQPPDDPAHDLQRMGVVLGHVVDHARAAAVGVGAPQFLGRDHLARGRLHQGRPAQEDGPLPAHDHRLVRHGRHIGAAGGARAHDAGDLGDALRAHPRLVEEDAPEVIAVGEDLGLMGQVRPAGVHQIDARQPVLLGDLLGPEVLLHGQREIGPALHRGVVGHDHHLAPRHAAHAGDQSRPRRLAVVEPVGGQGPHLQERRAGIQETPHPIAGQQLAATRVPLAGALRSAEGRLRGARAQLLGQGPVMRRIGPEDRRVRIG